LKKQVDFSFITNFLLLIFSVVLIFSTLSYPFYWDNTVQISVPANWYYQTNFKFFYLPDSIATGHPTFVGMYFALLWKLFGRSLITSHLGMFPFVFGLPLQIHNLLKNLNIKDSTQVALILGIIILDTTFLSQLSLITFDIIQLFFFFLCINSILTYKNRACAIYFVLLALTSLRGSIMAGGLLIFNLLYNYYFLDHSIKIKDYVKYIPGIISLFLFLLFFRINKGWVIHNIVFKAWNTSGEFASFSQFIRNIGVFIWRLIDFGRVGVFIFFLFFIIKTISIRKFQDNTLKILFMILFSQFIVFFPIIVTSQNPFGHRYLLPIIIPSIILTVYWIQNYTNHIKLWLILISVVLLSGHFWIYPLKISQGWDATTLHWYYFKVSEKMNSYINENKIDKSEIATFFPNRSSRYLTHLEDKQNDTYSGTLFNDKYILYSNSFNVNDNVIDSLFSKNSDWTLTKRYNNHNIFMSLYQKK
jgi:hypothetical protein